MPKHLSLPILSSALPVAGGEVPAGLLESPCPGSPRLPPSAVALELCWLRRLSACHPQAFCPHSSCCSSSGHTASQPSPSVLQCHDAPSALCHPHVLAQLVGSYCFSGESFTPRRTFTSQPPSAGDGQPLGHLTGPATRLQWHCLDAGALDRLLLLQSWGSAAFYHRIRLKGK